MGADYAEKEREFIAGLAGDTGSDLDGWMAAIAASGLADRNAIIDWLRHHGFQFSRASWLERIHHNGGRLIYAGTAAGGAEDATRPAEAQISPPSLALPSLPNMSSAAALADDIDSMLAAAKGLRPLADMVLREISAAVPATHYQVLEPLVIAAAKQPFAALWPQPKKLRLFATFGASATFDIRPAEAVQKAAPPFPQMVLLDDARRIDQAFRDLIAATATRAKS